MSISRKNEGVRFVFGVMLLLLLVTTDVYGAPVWGTSNIIAQSRNMGCMHSCSFGRHNPNSTNFVVAPPLRGEPFKLPEFSAGHFLVIPVAAVMAVGHHLMKVRKAASSS